MLRRQGLTQVTPEQVCRCSALALQVFHLKCTVIKFRPIPF